MDVLMEVQTSHFADFLVGFLYYIEFSFPSS